VTQLSQVGKLFDRSALIFSQFNGERQSAESTAQRHCTQRCT